MFQGELLTREDLRSRGWSKWFCGILLGSSRENYFRRRLRPFPFTLSSNGSTSRAHSSSQSAHW